MKRILICVFTAAVLVLTACQASETPPQATVTANAAAVEPQAEQTDELTAEDTIRRFFECFNSRDAYAINALMVQGRSMTLSEEESAILKLKSCTELQSDGEASVVEAVFEVELDERQMSSFDEGEYTWRFELAKGGDGIWRIANYGV